MCSVENRIELDVQETLQMSAVRSERQRANKASWKQLLGRKQAASASRASIPKNGCMSASEIDGSDGQKKMVRPAFDWRL